MWDRLALVLALVCAFMVGLVVGAVGVMAYYAVYVLRPVGGI